MALWLLLLLMLALVVGGDNLIGWLLGAGCILFALALVAGVFVLASNLNL